MLPKGLLGLAGAQEGSGTPAGRLASATTSVEALPPQALLLPAEGSPRGFWGTQDRWTAHAGIAAVLQAYPEGSTLPDEPEPTGPHRVCTYSLETPRRRFSALREAVQDLDREHLDPDQASLRFFGGLSFHPDHRSRGAWSAFPAARLTAPALRLEHDEQGTRLVATTWVPAECSAKQAQAEAGDVLRRAQAHLSTNGHSRTYEPGRMEMHTPGPEADWTQAVEEALSAIREGALEKVVLARDLVVACTGEPAPLHAFLRLREQNPGTHLFLHEPAPGSAFLCAAPELIASVDGRLLHATAVAGSVPRGGDVQTDDELARGLVHSEKDRAEHRIVVEHMRRRLARVSDQVQVGRQPHVLRLHRIQHLETDVFARLTPEADVLSVLEHVHPTPAVCGTPREGANRFLRDHEPFDRGWYAGPVGWLDARGNGAFAPGLRSAVLHQSTWRLFAGAGIVAGSDPHDEWEETGMKFEPVLRALGFQGGPL